MRLKDTHSEKSQALARAIKDRTDEQQYRKETGPAMSDEFKKRVREKIGKTKKRQDEERARGKGKGRERDFD